MIKNEQMVERVELAISAISEKIGEGADYFWPHLVAAEFAGAIGLLVVILSFFCTGATFLIIGIKNGNKCNWDERHEKFGKLAGPSMIISAIGTFMIVGFIIATVENAKDISRNLVAPEAAALKSLLEEI